MSADKQGNQGETSQVAVDHSEKAFETAIEYVLTAAVTGKTDVEEAM